MGAASGRRVSRLATNPKPATNKICPKGKLKTHHWQTYDFMTQWMMVAASAAINSRNNAKMICQ
jgi:hypothetical protein